MEEKKLDGVSELSDEALVDASGGGAMEEFTLVLCEGCRHKKVRVLSSGDMVTCPNCGATLICCNGQIVMCIRKEAISEQEEDQDGWL